MERVTRQIADLNIIILKFVKQCKKLKNNISQLCKVLAMLLVCGLFSLAFPYMNIEMGIGLALIFIAIALLQVRTRYIDWRARQTPSNEDQETAELRANGIDDSWHVVDPIQDVRIRDSNNQDRVTILSRNLRECFIPIHGNTGVGCRMLTNYYAFFRSYPVAVPGEIDLYQQLWCFVRSWLRPAAEWESINLSAIARDQLNVPKEECYPVCNPVCCAYSSTGWLTRIIYVFYISSNGHLQQLLLGYGGFSDWAHLNVFGVLTAREQDMARADVVNPELIRDGIYGCVLRYSNHEGKRIRAQFDTNWTITDMGRRAG